MTCQAQLTFEKLFEGIVSIIVLEHNWNEPSIFRFALSALIGVFLRPFSVITALEGRHGLLHRRPMIFIDFPQSFESIYIVLQQIHSFQYSLAVYLFSPTSRLSKFWAPRSTTFRFEVWFRLTRIVGAEVLAFASISCNKSQDWI